MDYVTVVIGRCPHTGQLVIDEVATRAQVEEARIVNLQKAVATSRRKSRREKPVQKKVLLLKDRSA